MVTPTPAPTSSPTPTLIPTQITFVSVPAVVQAYHPFTVTARISAGGGTVCTKGLAVNMIVVPPNTFVEQVVTTTCDCTFVFRYGGTPAEEYQLNVEFSGNEEYGASTAYWRFKAV